MDLTELLKQFNKIEPDQDYTRKSKLAILGLPMESNSRRTALGMIWSSIRFSTGAVVTGLVIVLIFAAFAIKISSPSPLAALDPITLRAEADAIDIQIQLATLGYENPANLVNQTTTTKIIPSTGRIKIGVPKTETPLTAITNPQGVKADSLDIDEALNKLSE